MKMNLPPVSGLRLAAALLAGRSRKTVGPAAPITGSFAIEMEQVVGDDPLILGTRVATANGFVVSRLALRPADNYAAGMFAPEHTYAN
jgi:hypothetical protein